MRRYVLIGCGPASLSAVQAIRKNDPDGQIVIVADDPSGYYSRPGLAYFLSNEVNERSLFPLEEKDFKALHVQRKQAGVTRINPPAHTILLDSGAAILYDRLLIATGAVASPLSIPGADLDGVVKLDNLADAMNIRKLAGSGRTAVVVGGGITALELVEGLIALGVHTHYFLRGSRYWSNVLDDIESHIVEQRLKKEGVEIHYGTELAEILGEKGRVAAVRTRDNRLIPCEMLAAAIGVQPRKELADAAGLKTDRGILVNEYLQTNQADIYAAGDVAQVYDPITRQYHLDSLWQTAREQGTAAGFNMSGLQVHYHKKVSFNVTRLAGLTTTIIGQVGSGKDADIAGIARGDSEIWRTMPDATAVQESFEINRVRIMAGERTLLGAVIMGNQTLSRPIEELIIAQADITPIRSQLLEAEAPLEELITNFWSEWSKKNAAQQP